jgi:uncharacterized protein YkwD
MRKAHTTLSRSMQAAFVMLTGLASALLTACDADRHPPLETLSSFQTLESTTSAAIADEICQPGPAGEALLLAINEARRTARRCGYNQFSEAPALTWNCALELASLAHARDMASNNFFSHTGSDGSAPSERATRAGYRWSSVGENLAAGFPDPKTVVENWLESPGHCANIMRDTYSETGGALYEATNGDFPIYWTQMFGHPR